MKRSVRTFSTLAGLESLVPEWRALELATPEATGFQSPAWRLCRGSAAVAPRVVTVREDGRLVMLLALQVEKLWGAAVACWLGEPLAQYGDALALPDPRRPAWLAAAEAEISQWGDVDLVALTRLRADGVLASCGAPLVLADPEIFAAPYIDLGAAPARRHKSVERRQRKLNMYGPPRFEVANGARERRQAAAQALAFKHQWLRDRHRFSASLSQPDVTENLLALAENGALRAHRLWAGERLVSVELGVKFGASYRSLIGAFDTRLAEASPGHALTLQLLEKLGQEGVTRFDFLPPADPYKMLFATGSAVMGALYRPLSAHGSVAAFALSKLRPLAKEALRAMSGTRISLEPLLRRTTNIFCAGSPAWAGEPERERAPDETHSRLARSSAGHPH